MATANRITWQDSDASSYVCQLDFMDLVIALRTGKPMMIAGIPVKVDGIEAEDGSLKSWNISGYAVTANPWRRVQIYWCEARSRVTTTYK